MITVFRWGILVFSELYHFVCNKRLSVLAQILRKVFEEVSGRFFWRFLKSTEPGNILLHTKKILSLAIQEMVNLDTL